MIFADAMIPIFTFGTVLFILPVLALAGIVAAFLKKRKVAKWLFISLPIAFVLGFAADFITLTYFYKPHRKPNAPQQKDTLNKSTEP